MIIYLHCVTHNLKFINLFRLDHSHIESLTMQNITFVFNACIFSLCDFPLVLYCSKLLYTHTHYPLRYNFYLTTKNLL